MQTCTTCGSSEHLQQEITFQVDPNDSSMKLDLGEAYWVDFFFCTQCKEEVSVEWKDDDK